MSDKNEKKIIGGFAFTNRVEAEQAEKEMEGVKFIRGKMNMDKPEEVLQLYNKMIRQNLFDTAIGVSYLKELQEYLQSIPSVSKTDILPIPVHHSAFREQMQQKRLTPKTPEKVKERYINVDYRNRYRVMRGIAAMLIICIIAMFLISSTVDNPTILNYEQKLIDRYAQWEEELGEREKEILERENTLGIDR